MDRVHFHRLYGLGQNVSINECALPSPFLQVKTAGFGPSSLTQNQQVIGLILCEHRSAVGPRPAADLRRQATDFAGCVDSSHVFTLSGPAYRTFDVLPKFIPYQFSLFRICIQATDTQIESGIKRQAIKQRSNPPRKAVPDHSIQDLKRTRCTVIRSAASVQVVWFHQPRAMTAEQRLHQ